MDSMITGSLNDNINMDSIITGSLNDNINMDSIITGSLNDNINMDSIITGSLTSLTPQPVRACPVLGHGFPVTYIMIFFVHGSLGMEVIVCFVDIGVIVDHRFLNFLFTT
jgi:hypothetical protein